MRNIKQIILCSMSVLLLTGCLQKLIIDDVQLIQGVVLDTEKDKIRVTIVCPVQKKGNTVQVFENIANTVKQGRESVSLKSAQPFVSGQLRVALFTKELAKKDLAAFDALLRDSSIGHTVYIGILEGNGYELFSGKYKNNFNVAMYIKNLLEHNMENGSLPYTNLYLSSFYYYRVGQDVFMPILKKQKDKIIITGIALFNKKKYVGALKPEEMFIFKGLLKKNRLNSTEFKIRGGHVLINNIRATPTYKIYIKNGNPSFYVQVKLNARIQEITKSIDLEKKKNIEMITKDIEKQLDTEGEKLTKKLQDLNVDPLGLGAKFKQQYRQFMLKKWNKIYKTVPVKVKYIVNLEDSGVIE
ncbi:spore gernimation protein GerH [Bacillus toyonensis]|uniref:Ger(x)C family spore germination protein n=2 Tax=Bacillus toyonensis TaxID=155322 RepID=UPI000BEFAF31|nr:Ger(x)C family spore germination protein [Bacillus toyonensis]PEK78274.1 spore gernimation protein GerH [Bacillus toyonensis]PFY54147.1 spore gernimation protein GerH [Bacillus toyonensis]PGD03033.1 spore gernimation protein GerH [Bacillus toyonensis]PHD33305.1 spore gernimation protein GerH [Bacillus toyonensis]PHG03384.1 spore gernimation protein GerH [Bacillus toyonensis]